MTDTAPRTPAPPPRDLTARELLPALVEIVSIQTHFLSALTSNGLRSVDDANALDMRLKAASDWLVAEVVRAPIGASPPTPEKPLAAQACEILALPTSEAQLEAMSGASPELWEAIVREIKASTRSAPPSSEVPTYLTPHALGGMIEVIIRDSDQLRSLVEAVDPSLSGKVFWALTSGLRSYRTVRVPVQ